MINSEIIRFWNGKWLKINEFINNSGNKLIAKIKLLTQERVDDLLLYYTEHVEAIETISQPSGYKVAQPADNLEIDDTYVYYRESIKMNKNSYTVEQKVVQNEIN